MADADVVRVPIQSRSEQAQRVIDLFRACPVGDVLTYETINAAAGCDVRETGHRYIVNTAKNRVLRDDGIHMAVIRGVGYKRLTEVEAAATLASDVNRSRNAARKGVVKAEHIDVLALEPDDRVKFVMRGTLCMLISESTKPKAQAKLAAVASAQPPSTAVLAQRMALEALKSGE